MPRSGIYKTFSAHFAPTPLRSLPPSGGVAPGTGGAIDRPGVIGGLGIGGHRVIAGWGIGLSLGIGRINRAWAGWDTPADCGAIRRWIDNGGGLVYSRVHAGARVVIQSRLYIRLHCKGGLGC